VRDDAVYLQHVAESINLVDQYLSEIGSGLGERLFREDRRTQDAVLRRLETLADAAGHLSAGSKGRCRGGTESLNGIPETAAGSSPTLAGTVACCLRGGRSA